jgi:hypothetical protein
VPFLSPASAIASVSFPAPDSHFLVDRRRNQKTAVKALKEIEVTGSGQMNEWPRIGDDPHFSPQFPFQLRFRERERRDVVSRHEREKLRQADFQEFGGLSV